MSIRVHAILSPAVLSMLSLGVQAATPDEFDWIPATVIAVAKTVLAVDKEIDGGAVKMRTVVDLVRNNLDAEVDDIPGWRTLTEAQRDAFLTSIAEIVVFFSRVAETGDLPGPAKHAVLADSIGNLVRTSLDIAYAEAQRRKPRARPLVRTLADASTTEIVKMARLRLRR